MNYKKGQKLVRVDNIRSETTSCPIIRLGEVVTFNGYAPEKPNTHIFLFEYPTTVCGNFVAAFRAVNFRPLLGDSAKSELISSFTEVTETSDCPIKQPQTETV